MSIKEKTILKATQIVGLVLMRLSANVRICVLETVLAQEICTLPVGERDEELRRVIRDLPGILDATEEGMRQALVANAKAGL